MVMRVPETRQQFAYINPDTGGGTRRPEANRNKENHEREAYAVS